MPVRRLNALLFTSLTLAMPTMPALANPAEVSVAPDASAETFASERITVRTVGSGPDVVLIPGLSSSPAVWESTITSLPGYRYHLVQIRGFAGLEPSANADGPVVAPVAEEIARYIEESELSQPALVGHSLGGALAMMVAARNPELAGKVMVVDMMPFMGAMFAPGATPQSVEPIAAQIRDGIANSPVDARDAMTRQTIASMVKTEALRDGPIADSFASDPAVSGRAMYDLMTTDLRSELANIDAPLAVLWAMPPSVPITQDQMAEFYRLSYSNVPQATVTFVPDSYHFIMFDAPAVFREALRDFLEGPHDGVQ
jgi:pimeloyl-ACP methyl ester carboxylesterase